MPTIDRRPRRRRVGAETRAEFATERQARAAADAVRGLPEAQREDAWRRLLPSIRRWILSSWLTPQQHDPHWIDRVARGHYLQGRFRRMFAPNEA
jgi:hypothetical protein